MFDLLDLPPVTDHSAAARIAELLALGAPIARRDLNRAMTATFGGLDADGHWTQRDSFEMLEHAIALHLSLRPYQLAGLADVAQASAIMAMLPTQTVRSEEQIDLQQFSTPVDIAAIAVLMAAIGPEDMVLEPSAGNGLLIVQAPTCAGLQLNEIDAKRRERLAGIFPHAIITGHDGAALVSLHARMPRPSVVVMNPPFSRSVGRGADDLAALRHLQAAIRRVAKGGRVVAIMPDWFAPSARMKAAYESVLTGCKVRTSLRLEHCYRKHGTDIAVRLYVIDKVAGGTSHTVIQRSSVAGFLDAVTIPPRASLVADTPRATLPVVKPSLFGAARKAQATVARTYHAPVRNNVLPVSYRTLATAAPLADQVGCYLPYRPSRIVFDVAGDHPTALVESVAMGSIPAPIPTHIAHLPERTVTERMLSSSQLETVVYAGHAWGQLLPGIFKPAKEGVGLTIDPEGSRYRKGFFLGDGTGAGKGRQVAACILDNWLQGRRRHIWVSKNEPLLEDARRDWTALGGMSGDLQPVSNWKIDQPIKLDEGVLFVTYPTLRSMRSDHSRLQQILDWAGSAFDGVIAFDEAHEMGGVAGGEGAMGKKEGSQQGIWTRARSWMDDDGQPIARIELQRPCRREYLREADLLETAWDVVDRETFEVKWSAEVTEAAGQVDTETIRLATGLLLPIWSALPSDHLAVNRIADAHGNSWLGRLVFDQHVVQLYTKLGIAKTDDLPVEAIARSVLSGRSVDVVRPFPMTLRRSIVNGNPRVEIVDAPASKLTWLKSLGCFTEIIAYRTRVFVPATDAETVLGRVLKAT